MSIYVIPPVDAFLSPSKGCVEIRRVDSGGYICDAETDESVDLAMSIIAANAPVSHWSVWDATASAPKVRRDKPYTAKEFKALLSGEDVKIVWCKRGGFRSPVLKVGAIDSRPASPKGKRPTSTRLPRVS